MFSGLPPKADVRPARYEPIRRFWGVGAGKINLIDYHMGSPPDRARHTGSAAGTPSGPCPGRPERQSLQRGMGPSAASSVRKSSAGRGSDPAWVAMIEWVGASVPADPMIELELVRGGRAECHGRNSATRKQLGARSLTIKQPTAAQRGKKKPRRKSLSSILTIH